MSHRKKTLDLRQTWFLWAAMAFVVSMFAFVILPKIDPKARGLAGQAAPDFNLELTYGGQPGDRIRLSNLQGHVVVLDFWASWCQPCKEQMAILKQLSQELSGQDVYVLGIATSDTLADAREFIEAHDASYPMAFDDGNAIAQAYGVTALPTIVVIDRSGRVVEHAARVVGQRELAERVRSTLEGR